MSQTYDRKRFTVWEKATDWSAYELMIPQCTMQPSIPRISEQLHPRFAAGRHSRSATLGLCPVARKLLLIFHPAKGRRLS